MPSIIFDVTRTGDLTRPGSVGWVLEGDLVDADLAAGQVKSGTVSWAANEATAKQVTINTRGNTTVNPNRTCRIRISNPINATVVTDAATTTIVDDDVAPGQPCSNPSRGPIRLIPTTQRILLLEDNGISNRFTSLPFRSLQALIPIGYRIAYLSINPFTDPNKPDGTSQGFYDHSLAGINRHADDVWDYFVAFCVKYMPTANIMYWDWEDPSDSMYSINVPAAVNYNRTIDTWHAATYEARFGASDIGVSDAHMEQLHLEAARYTSLFAKRLHDRADAAGPRWRNFEIASYTHPNRGNNLTRTSGRYITFADQARHISASLMCPYIACGALSCYFAGSTATMEAGVNDPMRFIRPWLTRSTLIREAFGPQYRSGVTINAAWYKSDGTSEDRRNRFLYPNDDIVIPDGFMTRLLNELMAVGVSAFTIYQSSILTDQPTASQNRANAVHQEIVDIVKNPANNFVQVQAL